MFIILPVVIYNNELRSRYNCIIFIPDDKTFSKTLSSWAPFITSLLLIRKYGTPRMPNCLD